MCAILGVLDYKGDLEAVQRLQLVKAYGCYRYRFSGTDCASRKQQSPPTR